GCRSFRSRPPGACRPDKISIGPGRPARAPGPGRARACVLGWRDDMRAMVLRAPRTPLGETVLPLPRPAPGQGLVRVHACGVCRTDLHVVDGELTEPKLPLVPGHEIVGTVAARGEGAERFADGDRVGVPWLGWTCGVCRFCRAGRENLCD